MTRILCLAVAILGVVAIQARAADQTAAGKANSPKAEFQITHDILVGTTMLKAGTYKFQCMMFGDAEFLVVTSADTNKEVARVPCTPEQLQDKVNFSDFRFTKRPDGVAELTAVRIRGEKVAHKVVGN